MDIDRIYSRRDITIVEMGGGSCLVIACDSCGGVGEKTGDMLYASNELVGALTARTAIIEVLAAGARVVSVSNAVCCEMEPTAAGIIRGVKSEMQKAGVAEAALGGSTEENFKTGMTAAGVSVVGVAGADALKFSPCSDGDLVILLGLPLTGGELLGDSARKIVTYSDISRLVRSSGVREIVPVGSKGILYEAENLAAISGLEFIGTDCGVDLKKSAGPSTCVIAAAASDWTPNLANFKIIGRMRG